jgi:hypothetical protein
LRTEDKKFRTHDGIISKRKEHLVDEIGTDGLKVMMVTSDDRRRKQ